MANTRIQIKRSSATATPTDGSLQAGELAYSYNSDRLFLGTANGANVQEIGGTYWLGTINAAFNKANAAVASGMDYPYVNAATGSSNSWANSVGTAGNNYTIQVGAASNGWANVAAGQWANTRLSNVIAGTGHTITWATTNGYTNATIALSTTAVSAATYGGTDQIPSFTVDATGRLTFAGNNAYLPTVYAFANTRANSSNSYADSLSTADRAISNNAANSANAYAVTVGAAGNTAAYAFANGTANAVNNFTNATYVKLTASQQTITGDLTITGNIVFGGNATSITSNNLVVNDSLIYLANNNPADILDIGFIGSYVNATSANAHTGLFRDHATKQYYLFQGYDADPERINDIVPYSNNMVNSVLVADFNTSNLTLGGANAITWINSLYPYANGVANASNAFATTIGASANGWANTLSTADRAISNTAANSANAYTVTVGAASNTWANTIAQNWANTRLANVVATAGRTTVAWTTTGGYTNATIDLATTAVSPSTYGGVTQIPVFTVDSYGRLTFAANVAVQGMDYAYANSIGAASNTWANTIAQNWANTRLANVVAGTGTTVTWTTTNGYTNATVGLATTAVAASTYGGNGTIPFFTVDAQGRLTLAGNSGINVSAASTGTLVVARGGTGNTTFIANGVLIGNGTNPVWGLQSSTEGHVLQVSAAGAPQFAMLDGGSF